MIFYSRLSFVATTYVEKFFLVHLSVFLAQLIAQRSLSDHTLVYL